MSLRVLITSTPGTGHLHPLVPLARELAARGHEVRWVVAADAVDRVESYGFTATAGGVPLRERMRQMAALGLPLAGLAPRDVRPLVFSAFFATIGAPVMREALAPVVDDFRPDVIVHDFCELAAAPVARARDIPHVTVAFSGAPTAPLLAPAEGAIAPVWAAEGLEPPADLGVYDHLYLHPWPAALGCRPGATSVVDSWHMTFDGAAGDPPPWVEQLGAERPCVYVTFGTEMGPMAPWASILAALGELDVDAVVTTGNGVAIDAAVPSNVRVETYVPQSFVLDRASLMVSHTGAGALAAALARGLPQLCVPIAADQWDNADACVTAGVAAMLEPHARDSDAIGDALVRLLGDPAVADRGGQVRAQVAAMSAVPATVDRIVALAG